MLSFRLQSSAIVPSRFYYTYPNRHLRYTNHILIAPYWTFIDNNDIATRQIYYRYSDNQTLLEQVKSLIKAGFTETFSPSYVFIATWDQQKERVNSEEVMILLGCPNTYTYIVTTGEYTGGCSGCTSTSPPMQLKQNGHK